MDASYWRQLGFELERPEVESVEDFFERWFPIYRLPGVGAYRSQEALFGSEVGRRAVFGDQSPDAERRLAVSMIRAGYVTAAVEHDLGCRPQRDDNLFRLFCRMENDAGPPPDTELGRAIQVGQQLGEVAAQMTFDRPEIAAQLPGFSLREAVFADLMHTLFVKSAASSPLRLPGRRADANLVMRFGHAVGVAEESLPQTSPRADFE